VNRDDERRLVYRELSRHLRPARLITAFENSERDWEHSALRMLENYSLTWGGAGALLVPVSGNGVIHEALWSLIEMFDADLWAVYNRTLRHVLLADPAGFDSWLQAKVTDMVETHGVAPEQARATFTAAPRLDAVNGRHELSDELLGEIRRRTGPVLFPEDLHVGYFGTDTTPSFPIMNVCDLRPLPLSVRVMDTTSLPPVLRVLIAMKCGGLAPRQQDQLERANVAVEQVQVGLDDLEELLMLSWRGKHDPPRVVLDPTALPTGRLAADETSDRRSYAVPSGLSLVGCEVLSRMHPGQYKTPLTLVVGSTADDFAFALALDRCGGPAWWVPDPASIPDESITRRVLSTLAWAIRLDRQSAEQTAAGSGVEVCSLSMSSDGVRDVSEQVRALDGGFRRSAIRHTDQPTLPPRRVTLITVRGHVNEPLDEPFRGDAMLRAVPALLPTAVNSTTPWKFSWWVDVEDSQCRIPNRSALQDLLHADPDPSSPLIRSGRDGICYHSLRTGAIVAGEPQQQLLVRPRLRFPDAATVFRHLFERAGYEMEESAAGRYRRLATELWGGFDEIHNDWTDDSTRALLQAWISTDSSGATPGIWDDTRRYLSFNDAVNTSEINIDDLRSLLDGYLTRGILSRGLVLKCSHCLNTSWYRLDDLSQSFTCSRCHQRATITEESWSADHSRGDPAPEPTFYYGLAEVVYQALRHDADVPIRAIGALRSKPTEVIQQATDSIVSKAGKPFELDLLALVDGRILIGEAKKGNRLESTATRERRWLNDLADIADAITADEVILATATEWRPNTQKYVSEVFASRRIRPLIIELGHGGTSASDEIPP